MRATFTPEQLEIERTIVSLAGDGLREARACLEDGWSPPAAEATLCGDFAALGIPEERGGFGGSLVDAVVAVEALARTLSPSQLPARLAAVHAAAAAGIDVRPALEGARWTIAGDEPEGDGPDAWTATTGGGVARGVKTLVPFGGQAEHVVVLASDGVALLPVGDATERACVDPARPCADLVLDGAPLAVGEKADAFERAVVLAAAELCGAARGAIELGSAYANDRQQFGRPIGSFQGVAFQLADAFVGVKAAWDLTLYAAWSLDVGDRHASADASVAKAQAGRAALFAAERAIQVHGGIGMTAEADPHLYLRRALFADAWLGRGRWHRRHAGASRVASPR